MRSLPLFLLLAACTPQVTTTCPPIREYDRATQLRMKEDLEALPADSSLIPALLDYKRLRDELRKTQ